MNEFGNQYVRYIRSLTYKQNQIGLIVSLILPIIVVLLFRNTQVVYLSAIVFFPFMSPRSTIHKMRSDNLQTWLCLSGNSNDIFVKMISITSARTAIHLLISLFVLIIVYSVLYGIGSIGMTDLAYISSLMVLVLIVNVCLWIIYTKLKKSIAQFIEIISILVICFSPITMMFIGPSSVVIIIVSIDVLLGCCAIKLVNGLIVNKENFIEGD